MSDLTTFEQIILAMFYDFKDEVLDNPDFNDDNMPRYLDVDMWAGIYFEGYSRNVTFSFRDYDIACKHLLKKGYIKRLKKDLRRSFCFATQILSPEFVSMIFMI